jgi:anti-anti-sigma regulatory factor
MSTTSTTGRARRSRGMSLKLKPKLNIAQVRTLQAQLNKALGGGRSVVLDGCHVERTDTASLQLLCAFFASSRAAGVSVRWKKAPAAVLCEDAAVLGVTEFLELPLAKRS